MASVEISPGITYCYVNQPTILKDQDNIGEIEIKLTKN
jgi:hypothetical protein